MLEDESDLLAPENFSMVEPGVYRSAFPRTKHIKFIQSLKLKSVIALIPEEYPEAMAEFYNSKNIILLSHGLDGNKWPFKDINHFEFNKALVDVLNENNRPLLIHCNKGKHRTGSLVGCLRKFRGWPLSAIIHEYYMFATPKARLEDLHFIETFDCSLLRLSDTVIGDSSS
jgi:tyrosine-protein phosphatase SIW14